MNVNGDNNGGNKRNSNTVLALQRLLLSFQYLMQTNFLRHPPYWGGCPHTVVSIINILHTSIAIINV